MNMLDTGGRELPGSTYSVASALLTFLAALADPVVPFALHQRCMECYNNTTLCKQVCNGVYHDAPGVILSFVSSLLFFLDKTVIVLLILSCDYVPIITNFTLKAFHPLLSPKS